MGPFSLMFVGVVLAIALAGAGSRWGRAVATLVTVAVLLVAAAVTFWIIDFYSTEQMVGGYADTLISAFGVSPLLAKAATAPLVIPTGLALAWAVSFSESKRRRGQAALAVATTAYFLVLWLATKDQRVSRQGEPLQCYVVTEQGVVWKDIRYQGTDPATGRPCVPAKPHFLPTLARLDALLRSGRPLEPVDPKGRFVTPIGEPLVWYYRRPDGELEFYNAPGFRPHSGDQLQPVTKAVVEDWDRREAEKAEAVRGQKPP